MELDKFTKGMNVDRAENLGCYNIDSSGIRGGISKRDRQHSQEGRRKTKRVWCSGSQVSTRY